MPVTSTTAGFSALSDHRRGQLAVGLAALCWSTAGFLQRELDVDLATQLAGRALFAGLALLAFTAATHRGATREATAVIWRPTVIGKLMT